MSKSAYGRVLVVLVHPRMHTDAFPGTSPKYSRTCPRFPRSQTHPQMPQTHSGTFITSRKLAGWLVCIYNMHPDFERSNKGEKCAYHNQIFTVSHFGQLCEYWVKNSDYYLLSLNCNDIVFFYFIKVVKNKWMLQVEILINNYWY